MPFLTALWAALVRVFTLLGRNPIGWALGWTLVTHHQEAGGIVTGVSQATQGAGQTAVAVGQAAQSLSRGSPLLLALLGLGVVAIVFGGRR